MSASDVSLVAPLIPAASALLGTVAGGLITLWQGSRTAKRTDEREALRRQHDIAKEATKREHDRELARLEKRHDAYAAALGVLNTHVRALTRAHQQLHVEERVERERTQIREPLLDNPPQDAPDVRHADMFAEESTRASLNLAIDKINDAYRAVMREDVAASEADVAAAEAAVDDARTAIRAELGITRQKEAA